MFLLEAPKKKAEWGKGKGRMHRNKTDAKGAPPVEGKKNSKHTDLTDGLRAIVHAATDEEWESAQAETVAWRGLGSDLLVALPCFLFASCISHPCAYPSGTASVGIPVGCTMSKVLICLIKKKDKPLASLQKVKQHRGSWVLLSLVHLVLISTCTCAGGVLVDVVCGV